MKKVLGVFAILLCITTIASVYVFAETKTGPTVTIGEVQGLNEAVLAPTKFPEFFKTDGDNPGCTEPLKKMYPAGLSGAPVWTKPGLTGVSNPVQFEVIPELSLTVTVPEANRTNSNLLVTWTVRVEGYMPGAVRLWPQICSPFHGVSYQKFGAGNVTTQLYVNGEKKGQDAVITIPDGGNDNSENKGVIVSPQPSDPTISGSFLIKKDEFPDGKLPASIKIEVKWYNDTSMKIVTPANQRILTAMLVPQS